jgi:acetyl-CoA synthetase
VSPLDKTDGEVVWTPSPSLVRHANLTRFMAAWDIPDVETLQARATADPAWFWDAVVKDLGWRFERPYDEVLDLSEGPAFARWFRGATTNVVLTCVARHAEGLSRNRLALVYESEDGTVEKWTYRDLAREVAAMAAALAADGVRPGDVVGMFLPMVPEAVVATYAVSWLGAIYVPLFSGYGAQAVATRLNDSGARFLITADGFHRRGRLVDMKAVADQALASAPGVVRQMVVRRTGHAVAWNPERDRWWHEARAAAADPPPIALVDPEHPLMMIYTSGTTGRPKGAVHVHAGFPLKAAQDLVHCFDLKVEDTLFWLTDMGWMMGPWAVLGGMAAGATLVIYDGSPDYPAPDRLWEIVDRQGVTVLGLSPTAVRALMADGTAWVRKHRLDSLRILGSTGEPWNPDPWRWFFQEVGHGRLPIINYSGGTEISGGIVSSLPIRPQKPCSFSGPVPGMAAVVLTEDGTPAGPGEVGELCVTAPWPGMTRGFHGDRQRYLETYWQRFEGVWVHGDWAMVDDDGYWYILGRSDDTIKVAGKRLGPAEAESAAVAHPAVREAAAIGVPHPVKGEVLVIFCVLNPGVDASTAVSEEIRAACTATLGKALGPERVHLVADLPRTRNGKIVRRAVRARYLGLDPGDLSSVENLSALDEIERVRPERQ